jgi:putative addiction module CopG family antidote
LVRALALNIRTWHRSSRQPHEQETLMRVSLTPELERLVNHQIHGGNYHTASDVVRDALRLLEWRDGRLRRIRAGLRVDSTVTTSNGPQLIHEHSRHIRTPEGLAFVARVYGETRADGVWIGWLQFEPLDMVAPVMRTERETSQASREALECWACGLESAYFEGAFGRARIVE